MKLFAVYIGGEHARANIELHDMRFVVAEQFDDTHAELRRQWWGTPESLHIDCWTELNQADGYSITLRDEPFEATQKLYYVNLGGYDAAHFTEVHRNVFVVAETPQKATVRALKTVRHWDSFHRDDMYEAEQCFCLNDPVHARALHIHLEKIEDNEPAPFTCQYIKIGRKQPS